MSMVGTVASFLRRRRGVALLAAAILVVGGAALLHAVRPKPPAPAETRSYGEALFARGDFAAAADALRAEYRVRPSPRAKRALVDALLAANDPAAALALLRRSDGADLPEDETRLLRAESLLRLEQPDEAAAEVAPLAQTEPGIEALIGARAHYAKGETSEAEARLAEALRSGGAAAQSAWLLRARYALVRNDFAAAAAAAARAEEAGAPRDAVAALRVESAIRSGDFDRARALLGPEKKTPRGESENAYLRILLDAAEGRFDGAAIRLRTIEPALSREPRGRLIAAYVREGAGDFAQAEKHFRRAAEAAPGDAVAQDALAAFLARQGRAQEAAFAAERLAEVAPEAARPRRAEALARGGDLDGAFAALLEGRSAPLAPRAAIFGLKAAMPEAEAAAEARARYYAAAADALTEGAPAPAPSTEDRLSALLAAEIALDRGDTDAAARLFGKARQLAPLSARAVAGAARATLARDGAAAARAVIFRAKASAPEEIGLSILAARVRKGEGRPREALALVTPVKAAMLQSPADAALFAGLVLHAGDAAALDGLAAEFRRKNAAAPHAIRVFLAAGRTAEAAAAARRALLAGPAPAEATAVSLRALAVQGDSQGEDRALVLALARRRPGDSALAAAAARLGAGDDWTAASAAAAHTDADDPERLRRAYLLAPEDGETAYRYALDRLAGGETRRGGALLAEACFWGARAACPTTGEGPR